VRSRLAPPAGADLTNHLALLELSRDDESRSRLLTTNFDTLFERAWWDAHQAAIASHAGPAMPQPKVDRFSGVLHLHGRLADDNPELHLDDTPLILTSSEFGDAYLRSGWATRYVYDLVRVCTVVIVGYRADDPPMRYLLEALEADRERYPDLHLVYALVPTEPDQYEEQRASWYAKGVEPILYTPSGGDHSPLYDTLHEWWRYADDPTAWRRERLRGIMSEKPDDLDEQAITAAVLLLGHGDASQLLGELSSDAAWLTELVKRRVFDREHARPGPWMASRIDDPEMIRACAGLRRLDDQSRWLIERAIEAPEAKLSAVRKKAWRLLLRSKVAEHRSNLHAPWFDALRRIQAGEIDYEARQFVTKEVRPSLVITKPTRWPGRSEAAHDPELISQLVHIDYRCGDYSRADEILAAWPQHLDEEIALFRSVYRTLAEALEDAADAGFLEGWDRASGDVPSVARHAQNAHRTRFYPITRVLADLWTRIAEKDPDQGRALALGWAETPFLLLTRLHLHALASREVFPAREAANAVRFLNNKFFWARGARVEIMRLITSRWTEFSDEDRGALEMRICEGVPREILRADADDDDEWASVSDSEVFKRLNRITAAGGVLSANSLAAIDSISQRHPQWVASPGDRDDFPVWFESGSGPHAHPDLLSRIADDRLVEEAMRLQAERYFTEGDLWGVFCQADPDRALRGLRARAELGDWDAKAWEGLLWAAHQKGKDQFQRELADALLQAPNPAVGSFLAAAVAWLQERREVLSDPDQTGGLRYFGLWDKLADLAYSVAENDDAEESDQDLVSISWSAPGGKLAWTLWETLYSSEPKPGCGLGPEFRPRFDRAVDARDNPGLLARVALSQRLAYLDRVTAAFWSDLVIGQALVHLQGWHRPTRPADDPGRHACDCGPGRHVMQDNTARTDLGVAADLDIAEHFCPSAQQHAVAHFRMPVAALLAGAAERHLVQD
jgi:SIR2-like domain